MKQINLTLLTLALCAFAAAPTWSRPATMREQIEQVFRQLDAAIARKDIAARMAFETDDCQTRNILGETYNKEQIRQGIIKYYSFSPSIRPHATVLSVAPTLGGVVVMSHEHTIVNLLGRRTHKMHVLIYDGLWRSVWVKTPPGWRERHAALLSSTITNDGKVQAIKPAAAPTPTTPAPHRHTSW